MFILAITAIMIATFMAPSPVPAASLYTTTNKIHPLSLSLSLPRPYPNLHFSFAFIVIVTFTTSVIIIASHIYDLFK